MHFRAIFIPLLHYCGFPNIIPKGVSLAPSDPPGSVPVSPHPNRSPEAGRVKTESRLKQACCNYIE